MSGVALVLIQVVSLLASALAVWKISVSGLSRKYRAFFAYLIFRVFYIGAFLFLDVKSGFYQKVFFVGRFLAWIFYIWVVVELFGLILARHRGFYTIGRWAMYASVAISISISALILLPHITPQMPQITKRFGYLMAGERGIDCSLTVFLLLMLAFLNLYTVPLSRNVVVHAVVYTIFFMSSTLGTILRSVFGLMYATEVDTGLMAVSSVCVLAWFFLLSAKGEETRVRQMWFAPEREERILYQLDALNATLLRVARK